MTCREDTLHKSVDLYEYSSKYGRMVQLCPGAGMNEYKMAQGGRDGPGTVVRASTAVQTLLKLAAIPGMQISPTPGPVSPIQAAYEASCGRRLRG